MTTHTLISFLGKARLDPATGYRKARYRFDNGDEHETPYFGLALKDHLHPDRLALFGTAGSMWDVLLGHLAESDPDAERGLALIEAVPAEHVTQAMLDVARPLIERALGLPCDLRIIDYGRDATGQGAILTAIATSVREGKVSVDLTHGFRHLAALGLLSSVFLERIQRLDIDGLYYGALEMTEAGISPVIRLDGLLAVQRWIDALDRFDQNGDYAVFALLLQADGLAADKARCLERAAYYERTMNLSDARAQLQTFLPSLDAILSGASGLFQDALRQRLSWARGGGLFEHQARLARFYLNTGDYLRAAILAFEVVITRECGTRNLDLHDWDRGRGPASEMLEAELKAGLHRDEIRDAYWMLKNLRNGLAHGNPAQIDYYRRIIADPQRLPRELETAMERMLNTTGK
ncbi:MAG: TIGR02221 family CRISPR-associated protein [Chromatiales bacterium]|nr:TIGR02221 family CRISPR-associated protein [Chromatiales bacterium]